jgi:hypothetical protein
MLTLLRGGLSSALRSKVGLAVIAAMLIGGSGTAVALTASHAQLPSGAHSLASAAHSATPTGHATAIATVSPTSVAGGGRGHHGHHHPHP